jgi:hemoglobin
MSDSSTNHEQEASDSPSAYEMLGGEQAVRALVDRFYDVMDLEAKYAKLRALHPSTLEESRNKLFWFLCGWLGGPDYFVERFGHPRLRARHLPYAIGLEERDQWLACMWQAMAELGYSEERQQQLLRAFYQTADWMRNQ